MQDRMHSNIRLDDLAFKFLILVCDLVLLWSTASAILSRIKLIVNLKVINVHLQYYFSQ